MPNLEQVIEDSISDSQLPDEPVETPETLETAPEVPAEPTLDTPESTTEVVEGSESTEVASPAVQAAKAQEQAVQETKPEQDEFEKKYGIPKEAFPGRENRIPYSRVKKIVANAEEGLKKTYEPRIQEFETRVKEFETKVTDYEGRLGKVAEFEGLMVNEPNKFLNMLATLPQYKAIFDQLVKPQASKEEAKPEAVVDDMPQPDQQLTDGSMVYSMDGLRELNAWNREQARKDVLAEVDKAYGPILKDREAQQRIQELIPQIQSQIVEARTWPSFTENEAEIVAALQKDQRLSLEGAYRQVVFPKITAERDSFKLAVQPERDKMRAELMAELRKAPASTSAPTRANRPVSQSAGPRSLEQVIADSLVDIKR